MAKRPTRELTVVQSTQLTENMLRITLGGEAMADFPADQESAYVKLLFPQAEGERPLQRSYTIRNQRATEIDIDFVLHDPLGPASSWAAQASPGDRVLVSGPGPKKLINHQADWFLLIADMAALPALSVNLEQLPQPAIGHAVIEIRSAADVQPLVHPPGVQLHWKVNPQPDPSGQFLTSQVAALSLPPGSPAIWAACEFNSMRVLRQHLHREHPVPNSHIYLSSYWKIGQSDEGHKQAKRLDSEGA
ncbi:siderophore-interacting protein [Roseimaritima ulvae]|uniref:Vibriobactin utilization protein ViuB n=1 Tax=Roseimaritima ulvae TaxID=980254 RepID=A0A5B9QW87_9BACT|nr:siderophore-interacting protein [Roseimaritima ulvae]QEG43308.1 Vibriobactin utilization protein ViuB [Roseimaritima ulvae]